VCAVVLTTAGSVR